MKIQRTSNNQNNPENGWVLRYLIPSHSNADRLLPGNRPVQPLPPRTIKSPEGKECYKEFSVNTRINNNIM